MVHSLDLHDIQPKRWRRIDRLQINETLHLRAEHADLCRNTQARPLENESAAKAEEICRAKANRASTKGKFSLSEASWKLESAVKVTVVSTLSIDSEESWTLDSIARLIEISAWPTDG